MTELYDYMVKTYGYNEPIFLSDLTKDLDINSNTLRQSLKRLSDKNVIKRAAQGIYFIPRKNSILKNSFLSVDKIVSKKFLNDQNDVIGYKTGVNFANSLGLTSQTASIPIIVSNRASSTKREVSFYNKKVEIRKPKAKVNSNNYKLLQVLDLMKDFERLSEKPLDDAKPTIIEYLKDVKVSKVEFKEYLKSYPNKARAKIYESEIYNEIAQR